MAKWILYRAGTIYKARDYDTDSIYSGPNLKTDIWDNIKRNPARRTRIHFLNSSVPYDIPSNCTLDIPTNASDYYMSGESMYGVLLRPLGNDIAMSCTNLRRAKFENLGFYVDQGSAYTTDIFRIISRSGGCESIELANIKMRHDDGTNALTQTGRNLVLLLNGTNPNISWLNVHDCHMFGSDSAVSITSYHTSGFPWCNENIFTRVHGTHNRHYFLSQMPARGGAVTNSMAHRWVFRDCSWQTTSVESTTTAMFRIYTNASHRGFLLDGCMMWDPASTNNKFLINNSTNSRIAIVNSEPIGDAFMGGIAWDAINGKWKSGAHVTRQSELSVKRGVSNLSDGGTVTHGMVDYTAAGSTVACTPNLIRVQATIAGEFASVTGKDTTTFTVAIKKHDGTAGTTQDIYWEAIEYV